MRNFKIKNYHLIPLTLVLSLFFVLAVSLFSHSITKPQFSRAPLFSGWVYRASLPLSRISVSAKNDSSSATINFQYQNSGITFDLPVDRSSISTTTSKDTIIITPKNKTLEAKYRLLPHGLKEEIILTKTPTTNEFASHIQINNAIFNLNTANLPVFTDPKTHQYLFHFERPYAIDAKGNKTYDIQYLVTSASLKPSLSFIHSRQLLGPLVTYKNIKEYQLILKIDPKWLFSSDRAFPVTIDPTIIHDTQSEFSSGTFNRVQDIGTGDTAPFLETAYQELTNDSDTVGLWHLNESTGTTLVDVSGIGNTGTIGSGNSAPTFGISTIINTGISFGSGDYISLPSPNNSDFTVEFWTKVASIGSSQALIVYTSDDGTSAASNEIKINPSGNLIYRVWDGASKTITGPAVSANTWYHLAITGQDNGSIQLFLNGNLVGSTSVGTIWSSGNKYLFGKNGALGGFNGLIDEVRISNVVRSAEEIKVSASRRPYSIYTSPVIDLGGTGIPVNGWRSLTWTELGVATGDGETLSSGTSLVAQWNFNETTGPTAAASAGSCGASCNGTLVSFGSTASQDASATTGWTANNRRWGAGALMFDGTDDYVNFSSSQASMPSGNSERSVTAWVKTNTLSGDHAIAGIGSTGASNAFFLNQYNNYFRLIGWGNDLSGPANLEAGQWYYVVGTHDGTTAKLYVNGILVASGAKTLNTVQTNAIVGNYNNYNAFFQGTIDSVTIYSRALTAAEILSNYNSANIEFQTRSGNTTDPNDGTWDIWKPSTDYPPVETILDDLNLSTSWTPSSSLFSSVTDNVLKIDTSSQNLHFTPLTPSSTNLASGKSYTTSPTPSGSYPDSGSELTDGQYSTGWGDGKSVGFYNLGSTTPSVITVDLGSPQAFTQVGTYFSTGGYADVGYPDRIIVATSADGSTFTSRGFMSCPGEWTGMEDAEWCYVNIPPTIARYVRISATQAKAEWTMWSEISVTNGDYFTSGLWHLDETSGTGAYLIDSSTNALHGTPTGTTLTNGVNGKARTFGVGSSISIPTSSILNDDLHTIDFWIRFNQVNVADWREIFTYKPSGTDRSPSAWVYPSQNCIHWRYDPGNLGVNCGGPTGENSFFTTNRWYHVAGVKEYSHFSFYVDGNLVVGVTVPFNKTSGTAPIVLGNNAYISLDEFRVSGVVRSAEEISEIYHSGVGNHFSRLITSADLSSSSKVVFDVASDRPGTYLESTIGESAFANYEPDTNTVTLLHFEDRTDGGGRLRDSSYNQNYGSPLPFAIGGTISSTADFTVHTFKGNGTFTTASAGLVEYLVVAGGGGGAKGGGGGAGGMRTGSVYLSKGAHTVTIGAGGSGITGSYGTNGGNSVFDVITSTGGGGGGGWSGTCVNGRSGGSGGGSGMNQGSETCTGGSGTSGQGNTGGGTPGQACSPSGGGGGAGGAGGTPYTAGIGSISSITGTNTYYAGGGGGGSYCASYGVGGSGGGGNGSNSTTGAAGTANTGGGGGGGGGSSGGGNGGSGVVIVRYRNYLNSGASSSQGVLGKAITFNGTNDYATSTLDGLSASSTNVTVDFWANVPSAINSCTFMALADDTSNRFNLHFPWGDGNIYWDFGDMAGGNGRLSTAFNSSWYNTWAHWAFVSESGVGQKIYRNGVLIASDATASTFTKGTKTLTLGSCNSTSNFWPGQLDEFRISNVARSATDIRQAYEVGKRSRQITIDFGAKLDSSNLIGNTGDLTFTVDATTYGLGQKADKLFPGDKIIIREKVGATTYSAQGTVDSVTPSTGAVTVNSWDTSSTAPSGGFTANADVFKWQREYFDLSGIRSTDRDAISYLTFRSTNTNEAPNFWIDDIRAVNYLSSSIGSTLTSNLGNRYFQYRAIESSSDSAVSPQLSTVSLDYALTPAAPTACRVGESSPDNKFVVHWTDNATLESGYEVGAIVNGAVGTTQILDPDTTSVVQSIAPGYEYAFRVRAFTNPSEYSEYCYTPTLTVNTGNMKFGGVKMQGVKVN